MTPRHCADLACDCGRRFARIAGLRVHGPALSNGNGSAVYVQAIERGEDVPLVAHLSTFERFVQLRAEGIPEKAAQRLAEAGFTVIDRWPVVDAAGGRAMSLCRCGHPRVVHTHNRAGNDCSHIGCGCPHYRRPRWWRRT